MDPKLLKELVGPIDVNGQIVALDELFDLKVKKSVKNSCRKSSFILLLT